MLREDSEPDVLASRAVPFRHPTTPHATNPWERPNNEVKRQADAVGIFANEASIARLSGAVLPEHNNEWLVRHRYMQVKGMAALAPPLIDPDPAKLSPRWPDL